MSADPVLDFCRADKAALDRLRYLATHTNASLAAIHRDPAFKLHNRAAGHYWHRLTPVQRAAVQNPNRREG